MTADVQDKWLKWVALTTTILAVCAAFGSLRSGSYSTQIQMMTTRENDKWSFYQAKSLKQHISEEEVDLFKLELLKNSLPAVTEEIKHKLKSLEDNIVRYDKEKEDIKTQAENLEKAQEALKRHGGNFGLSVMLLQIAIMLSAIASVLKQRISWLFGLAIGLIGIVYFINGFLLYF